MRALVLLLTHVALPPGTLCFLLHPERDPGAHSASGTNQSATLDNGTAALSGDVDVKVLPLANFTEVWNARYSQESHLHEPLPSSIRLILGVFTVAQDAGYRQVVRQTWLQQAGVCYWSDGPQDDCSVYTAFVIGKSGSGSHRVHVSDEEVSSAHKEDGMVVLDMAENMNGGKSLYWFRTAAHKFPWATHIAKMDMDTYPFLHKLLHRMDTNRSCVEATGPYEFIGRPKNNCCGPIFREACPYEQCQGQFTSEADKHDSVALVDGEWRYLSGEFYIMSLPLAQKLSWASEDQAEDVFVSHCVNEAARKHHLCVTLRRLDAWFHDNQWLDPSYANKF